jgi:hypothetical protein
MRIAFEEIKALISEGLSYGSWIYKESKAYLTSKIFLSKNNKNVSGLISFEIYA